MARRVKICAPDIFEGDAVGNHSLGIARMARRLGYDVTIYAQNYESYFEDINPIRDLFLDVDSLDILVISYSIFDKYLDDFLELNCKKICYFHGVTSPDLMDEFDSTTAKLCYLAKNQINKFKEFDIVICNSKNTSSVLKNIVHPEKNLVIPPVFSDMSVYKNNVCSEIQSKNLNFIMVGRCVPHKNIELAMHVLVEIVNHFKNATLTIVGSTPNYAYLKFLINKARELGILNRIDFAGSVNDQELSDLYSSTTGLLVTSRHEGFGVPVLEAMRYGKPVFMLGGTAAEELDIDGNIFTENNLPKEWAKKIKEYLSKNKETQQDERKKRIQYAIDVLHLTDDIYWSAVLKKV